MLQSTNAAPALLAALLLAPAPALAQGFSFTLIADTSTSIPGGSGTFDLFDASLSFVNTTNMTYAAVRSSRE